MDSAAVRKDATPWLLSARETRKRLKVDTATLRALVTTGRLPPPALIDGRQFWPEPVVTELADSGELAGSPKTTPAQALPECGLVRLSQFVPAIIPVARSTWWAGVKSGRYPQPVRTLGGRITAWKVQDIRALIESAEGGE